MNANDLERWLAEYGQAWVARDPGAVAGLFTESALYFETPYAEPFKGRDGVREYWSKVTADQRDVDFESETIGVVGNIGIARWSARFNLASSGGKVELNGVFLLEFDEAGRCAKLREWWHAR